MLILRAALRYFSDSERSDVERWDIPVSLRQFKEVQSEEINTLSKESPLHSSSSIFLVMILVTSCKSSFNFSSPDAAAFAVRVSWYSRAVFDMNVSVCPR
jgi:hypothetical protein